MRNVSEFVAYISKQHKKKCLKKGRNGKEIGRRIVKIFNIVESHSLLLIFSYCERFEPRSLFISRLSVMVWVNVLLSRTVVVYSD